MPEIPQLAQSDLLNQFLSLFPEGWAGDDARGPGGKLWALYQSLAGGLADQLGANPKIPGAPTIQFARDLTRISTATGVGLDTLAQDFFGATFPRMPTENDVSYRARILAALLVPRVTRPAISNAIAKLTGQIPRMTEPWNPGDTSAYDELSFFDTDYANAPARYGDELPYQGMIELNVPLFSITGAQAVWGFDDGAAFDVPTSAYFDFTQELSPTFEAEVSALIAAFKAEGTLVWLRNWAAVPSGLLDGTALGVIAFLQGAVLAGQVGTGSTFLLRNLNGKFTILLETPSWMTSTWIVREGVNFTVAFSDVAPAAGQLGWLARGFDRSFVVPVNQGQTRVELIIPTGPGSPWQSGVVSNQVPALLPLITALFNTRCWIDTLAVLTGSVTVGISLSAPGPGNLYVVPLPAGGPIITGRTIIPAEGVTATVPITGIPAGAAYAVMTIPTWNTEVAITQKNNGSFVVAFSDPAPSTGVGTLFWAVVEGV